MTKFESGDFPALTPALGSTPASRAGTALSFPMRAALARCRRDRITPALVGGVLRLVELALLAGSGLVLLGVHVGYGDGLDLNYAGIVTATALLTVFGLASAGCYEPRALFTPWTQVRRILCVWAGLFALLAVAGFLMKISADFSRIWFAGWFAAGFVALVLVRLALAGLVRNWARSGTMERRAVIVGGGAAAESLIEALDAEPFSDIRICGIFDDRDDRRSPPIVAGYRKLGTVAELIEFARRASIDLLIVSLPLTAETRVLSLLKQLWVLPVDIRLSAHTNRLRFRPRAYSYIGTVPMLDVFDRPINGWDRIAKRAFDLLFSVLGIAVFSPIMLAVALAIKLDSPGPVLFRQRRHGFNNEIIEIYKFRSMYADRSDPSGRLAVTRNDPRVTRVGAFIRKTSIDELPQFFNALLGSLSLVGPRPHAVAAQAHDKLYNDVVEGYFARHRVKPGVTGWAQINGWRGEIDNDDKIRIRTQFDLN